MNEARLISMEASKQAMYALAINNNNLANLSTPGFKADIPQFTTRIIESEGYFTSLPVVKENVLSDFKQGPLLHTGRELDIAVQEANGFIAVQGINNSEGYTRAGNLKINAQGLLSTGDNHVVVGNSGPITIPPAKKIAIGSDGTISILPVGENSQTMVVLDRIKLANPEIKQLHKGEDGLFYLASGAATADANITVVTGALEGSNVSSVGTLTRMVELAREHEAQIKLLKIDEQKANKSTEMLRIPVT